MSRNTDNSWIVQRTRARNEPRGIEDRRGETGAEAGLQRGQLGRERLHLGPLGHRLIAHPWVVPRWLGRRKVVA